MGTTTRAATRSKAKSTGKKVAGGNRPARRVPATKKPSVK